jgi:hypothetical protein
VKSSIARLDLKDAGVPFFLSDVGEHGVLDAETAAGMRRRPQPQPIAWDTQSHRHDRVHGKRALEIGDDLETGTSPPID